MWFIKGKRKPKQFGNEGQQALSSHDRQYSQDEVIQLIKGKFNAVEAADILLSLINEKIKYHTVKSLKLDQYELDQSYSKERLKQLREDKKSITDLVIFANRKGLSIDIEGKVVIRLNKDKAHNQ